MTYDTVNECYNGSDGKKYISVGSTARFNQGAYHPVFNSGGTARYWYNNSGQQCDWYLNTSGKIINIANTQYIQLPNIDSSTGGASINHSGFFGAYSGRPDSKFHNVIYNELFIDQRWRAEYLDGTKERTTIERDKDISASQYADFVGSATLETKKILNGVGLVADNFHFSGYKNTNDYLKFVNLIGRYLQVYYSDGTVAKNILVTNVSDYSIYGAMVTAGNTQVYDRANTYAYVSVESNLRYGSNTFLHTDIIGNPANYPQVWKDALAGGGSIAGTPLLVGENGEDYNDMTTGFKKLSKKVQTIPTYISPYTDNAGSQYITWVGQSINSQQNGWVSSNTTTTVLLQNYQAYNNNLTPIANSRVIGGSAGVSDVIANLDYYLAKFNSKLINKVSNSDSIAHIKSFALQGIMINLTHISNTFVIGSINEFTNQSEPNHDTINLYSSTSPAVKTFSYLTQNTRAKQVYVFKEMKFATDWGDDNKFNIVDNVSTVVDDNGSTVLVGQKARLIDGRIKE